MAFCTNCGSELGSTDSFCVECGTAAPAAATIVPPGPPPAAAPALPPPPAAPPVLPPPPTSPPSATGLPPMNIDLAKLLAGNWLGSAVVALAMLVTAVVLSTVLALMAKPEDFGIDNTLTGVMMILAATFGADAFLSGDIDDVDLSATTSTYPLTATIVTFAVGVLAFRRMVRDYPSAVPGLGDALRVALFVSVPLFVGSFVFRSDLEELGGGWIAEASDDIASGDDATWGVSAPTALFVSFGLVAFVLALACLARRDWWHGPTRPVAEWCAPGLQAIALMTLLLPLCGLIGIGLIALGPDNSNDLHDATDDEGWAAVAVLVGGLGNGGQALLGLGSGGELGAAGEFESDSAFEDDESEEEFHRLAYFAGEEGEEPWLWAAPGVLLAVIIACAAWVAGRTREKSQLLRNLAVWCALLLAAVPWLTRLSNLHGSGDVTFEGDDGDFSGFVGLAGGQATLFIFLIAVAVSLVIALARGAVDVAAIRAQLSRLQSTPAAAAPTQPTQPPPSYPPPPPPTA